MTAFRQAIRPNDKGLDVLAVKRAMKQMKVQDAFRLKLNRTAGAAFVHCVKAIQHNHKLTVDGIYGRSTHALMHFDARSVYLYNHAKIRKHSFYVNPFHLAKISLSRTDMGVDFHGTGPIVALGDSEYLGNDGRGWPGGNYMHFRLLNGPHADCYWFIAEAIEPLVHRGQIVKAGEVVCRFGRDAAPGRYPGIEIGWSSPTINRTRAAATTGYYEGERTPAGKAFARLLRSLGCPTREDPGPGPTYV